MRKVTDAEDLLLRMREILKAGMMSDSVPDADRIRKETEKGNLSFQEYDDGIILLYRRGSFDRISWMFVKGAKIPDFHPKRTAVLEFPYRSKDEYASDISLQWEEQGFEMELQRVRMTRRAAAVETELAENILIAEEKDLRHVMQFMNGQFDELTGCIPGQEALHEDIVNGNVLMTDGGMLHFNRKGKSSEIRHLAVEYEYRNQGKASELLSKYLSRCGEGICRVWTGKENTEARELYRRHGFAEDGWQSDVRVFRKEL